MSYKNSANGRGVTAKGKRVNPKPKGRRLRNPARNTNEFKEYEGCSAYEAFIYSDRNCRERLDELNTSRVRLSTMLYFENNPDYSSDDEGAEDRFGCGMCYNPDCDCEGQGDAMFGITIQDRVRWHNEGVDQFHDESQAKFFTEKVAAISRKFGPGLAPISEEVEHHIAPEIIERIKNRSKIQIN